jgi:FkbM family methyltransferase
MPINAADFLKFNIVMAIVPLFAHAESAYLKFDAQAMVHFLEQFIKPGDLVFDVGANVGDKTNVYLACGARVICIEPQPSCVRRLMEKYAAHQRVKVEAVGLASQKGELDLHLCDQVSTLATFNKEATEQGRFAEHNYHWSATVKVPVMTLEDMIAKHGVPQFCKIDVENYELEVLRGLKTPIAGISFECNSEYMLQTLQAVDYLASLGYSKFNFVIAESSAFWFNAWKTPEEFKRALSALANDHDWSEIWGLWGDVYAMYV